MVVYAPLNLLTEYGRNNTGNFFNIKKWNKVSGRNNLRKRNFKKNNISELKRVQRKIEKEIGNAAYFNQVYMAINQAMYPFRTNAARKIARARKPFLSRIKLHSTRRPNNPFWKKYVALQLKGYKGKANSNLFSKLLVKN